MKTSVIALRYDTDNWKNDTLGFADRQGIAF